MAKTVLRYEKELFTRAEVLSSKKDFKFPRAWKLSSNRKNWLLSLDEKLAKKLYFKKKRR